MKPAMQIIDVDCPETWPAGIRDSVRQAIRSGATRTEYPIDLRFGDKEEESFPRLFEGYLLRAYHCTRLLKHEVEAIRSQGLRRLTESLIRERLERAHEVDAVSREEMQALLGAHLFARRDDDKCLTRYYSEQRHSRENKLCLVLSRTVFDDKAHSCEPLLSNWGGEGIYFFCGKEREPKLRKIGTPTIVSAALDIAAVQTWTFPSLLKNFAAKALGLEGLGADVFYLGDVPPDHILDFFHPGMAEYDRHVELPCY